MTSTAVPILPKPTFSTPVIYVPVTFARTVAISNDSRIDQFALSNMTGVKIGKTVVNVPPAPPPPPPSLLSRSKQRVPLLIDQRSLKKNLQFNKISLQRKLARRPEPDQLIDRNILRTEGAESRLIRHRETLQLRIEKRPPRQDLVTQRILLCNAGIDPLVQERGQLLQRCKLADNLNSKLRKRPGPLELVTRKILQVDAELEQAIEEGRLPFTATRSENELDRSLGMISTLNPPTRFDAPTLTQPLLHSQSPPTVARSQKGKVRKKSTQIHRSVTPYDNVPSAKVAKTKVASKKSHSEMTSSPAHSDYTSYGVLPMETDGLNTVGGGNNGAENNYEITLKQQQIFLQWQEDHYKTVNATESNAVTPALSSTTSNCSTPLQSNDALSMHSSRSSFSTSSATSINHGNSAYLQSGYSPSLSPPSNGESVHVAVESDKPRSKLADLKVNDLKNECKKRSLPVSGAKPQLVERLRPYEKEILVHYAAQVSTSANCSTTSDVNTDPTTTVAVTKSTSCSHLPGQTVTYCQSQSSIPVHDVIHDYLQQCQPQPQQKPIILQLPMNSKTPQSKQFVTSTACNMENLVVKVLDSNGTVIGMGTMPQQRTVMCCCAQCKQTPSDHVVLAKTSEPSTMQPMSLIHPPTAPQMNTSENMIGDATFSFSQMGSGGQFTLAQCDTSVNECRSIAPNCTGCMQAAGQSTVKTSISTPNGNTDMTPVAVVANKPSQSCATSPQICLQTCATQSPPVEQVVMTNSHRRHTIAAPPVINLHENVKNTYENAIGTPDSVVTEHSMNGDETMSQKPCNAIPSKADDNDVIVEEVDPSVLLTAKTFSQHEENLRHQHRRIEELQAELAKSQEQLRREQQLIIAVKKSQMRTDEKTGKECTQAQILLNNLDIKNINKTHIQHFLQHKNQHQHLQNQASNYEQLLQVEQQLQEELHIEQAVQDIVRLIKQDGRTALLIVQLLRRYQLERNHQLQQNKTGDASSSKQGAQGRVTVTTNANLFEPAQGGLKTHQQATPVYERSKSTMESECRCGAKDSACSISRSNSAGQPAPVVVIDDSPMPSPKHVPEKVSKPEPQPAKEPTSRSKSQNTKGSKRKNGARSIWTDNTVEKSASGTTLSKPKNNAKNASTSSPAPSRVSVDMEEIFRTVINDANRSTEVVTTQQDDQTSQILTEQIEQFDPTIQMDGQEHMDVSSELVPQFIEFRLVKPNEDHNGMTEEMQMNHVQPMQMDTEYSQMYYQQPTENCNTTAVFVQPEIISTCHADCFSKPGNDNSPDRLHIVGQRQDYLTKPTDHQQQQQQQHQQHQQNPYQYHNNEELEDLMDVLRDDQDGIAQNPNMDNTDGELQGYTREIAHFLQSDCDKMVNINPNSGYERFQNVSLAEMNHDGYIQLQPQYQQMQVVQPMHDQMLQYTECIDPNGSAGHSNEELPLEQHQEQAINDMLNIDNIEPNVEWFDNYFAAPQHANQMSQYTFRHPPTPLV